MVLRLWQMLRGQTVICRAALRMASLTPTGENEERTHLSRASEAAAAAFRLHQLYMQTVGAPPPLTSADGKADLLPSTLQMINFEVALRKKDPNAKEVLRKVCTSRQPRWSWEGRRAAGCTSRQPRWSWEGSPSRFVRKRRSAAVAWCAWA
jgi:hypothetical protein